MSSGNDNVRDRMKVTAALAISDDAEMVMKKYLTSFPLSLLQRIYISRNVTVANSSFSGIANIKNQLVDFIFRDVFHDKKKRIFI